MQTETKYFITNSNGFFVSWHSDIAGLETRGQKLSITTGSIGDDSVYVGRGTQVNATGLTSSRGNDSIYLTGTFDSYTQHSPEANSTEYKLSRIINIDNQVYNEIISFVASNGDKVYFSDGYINLDIGALQNTDRTLKPLSSLTLITTEKTPDFPLDSVQAVTKGNNTHVGETKIFISDPNGENISPGIKGSVLSILTSSIKSDTVYVAKGTQINAIGLTKSRGEDSIYLTGNFAEYTQAPINTSQEYKLSRMVDIQGVQYNESVIFVASNKDRIYFADGYIKIDKDILINTDYSYKALTAGMLDTSEITPGLGIGLRITDDQDTVTKHNITYTFTFDKAVKDFDISDIMVADGSNIRTDDNKGIFATTTEQGIVSGTQYTLVVTPENNFDGDLVVSVANGAANSIINLDTSLFASNTQAVDTVAPTLVISLNNKVVSGGEIAVTFTFSEVPMNFTQDDIILDEANGTIKNLSLKDNSDNKIYLATFVAGSGNHLNNIIKVGLRWEDAASNTPVIVTNSNSYDIKTLSSPSVSLAQDTGSSAVDGVTKNNQINVAGIGIDATLQYRIGNGNWIEVVDEDKTNTSAIFTLNDGVYSHLINTEIQVRQTFGGIFSEIRTMQSITIDTQITQPILSLATPGTVKSQYDVLITKDNRFKVTGLESGVAWQYRSEEHDGVWQSGVVAGISGISYFNHCDTIFNTGTDVEVRQTDVAGNTKGVQTLTPSNYKFSIDTLAPVFDVSYANVAVESAIPATTVIYTAHAVDKIYDYSNQYLGTYKVKYTISGDDSQWLEINQYDGELTFKSIPDFQNPKDHDKNNKYDISVIATDAAGNSVVKDIVITVNTVIAPTLHGTPTISFTGNGNHVGDSVTLQIVFNENVNGLNSHQNNNVFQINGKNLTAVWSGVDGTNIRALTYSIASGDSGNLEVNKEALKTALKNGITDAQGNNFVLDGVVGNITMLPTIDTDLKVVDLNENRPGVQNISKKFVSKESAELGVAFYPQINTPWANNIKTIKIALGGEAFDQINDKLVLDSVQVLNTNIYETNKTINGVVGLEYAYDSTTKIFTITRNNNNLTREEVKNISQFLKLQSTSSIEGKRTATISYLDNTNQQGGSATATIVIHISAPVLDGDYDLITPNNLFTNLTISDDKGYTGLSVNFKAFDSTKAIFYIDTTNIRINVENNNVSYDSIIIGSITRNNGNGYANTGDLTITFSRGSQMAIESISQAVKYQGIQQEVTLNVIDNQYTNSLNNLVTTTAHVIQSATLEEDTNDATDGITSNNKINVIGIEVGAILQYRTGDGGWHTINDSNKTDTVASFNLDDGVYSPITSTHAVNTEIQIRQVLHGVFSVTKSLGAITIDTQAPTTTATLALLQPGVVKNQYDVFVTNNSLFVAHGLEIGTMWQYRLDGNNWKSGGIVGDNGTVQFSYDPDTILAFTNKVQVRQTDAAGNIGDIVVANGTPTFSIDTIAPNITSEDNVAVESKTPAGLIIYTATSLDFNPNINQWVKYAAKYEIYGDDVQWFDMDQDNQISFKISPHSNSAQDKDGNNEYKITLAAEDTAGNRTVKDIAVVIHDAKAPTYLSSNITTTGGGTGPNDTIMLTVTLDDVVIGLSGPSNAGNILTVNGVFINDGVTWSGTGNTRTLTYTITNQNGWFDINEEKLRKTLVDNLTDVAGHRFIYNRSIDEIDTITTLLPIDTIAPVQATLYPIVVGDMDKSGDYSENDQIIFRFSENIQSITDLSVFSLVDSNGISKHLPLDSNASARASGNNLALKLSGTGINLKTGDILKLNKNAVLDIAGNKFADTGTIDIVLPTLAPKAKMVTVTNLDVRSDIVLTFEENIMLNAGKIHTVTITDKTIANTWGFDNNDNTQVITVTNSMINGKKLILNPKFDLDLNNNYEITFSAGIFIGVSTNQASLEVVAGEMTFSTVEATSSGSASQKFNTDGTLESSYNWVSAHGDDFSTWQEVSAKNHSIALALALDNQGRAANSHVAYQDVNIDDILYLDKTNAITLSDNQIDNGGNWLSKTDSKGNQSSQKSFQGAELGADIIFEGYSDILSNDMLKTAIGDNIIIIG